MKLSFNDDEIEAILALNSLKSASGITPIQIRTTSNAQNILIERTIEMILPICSQEIFDIFGSQLRELICSVCKESISLVTNHGEPLISLCPEKRIKCLSFSELRNKDLSYDAEILLIAAAVYYLFLQSDEADSIHSVDELLKEYSQYYMYFSECFEDPTEGIYLLNFRNIMKCAIKYIPAKRNKILLISVCSLLEGSGRRYATGGTQSAATTRRTIIYEHESGELRVCRPNRRIIPDEKRKCESKKLVKCACGAIILKRTMWKHGQSKKHINFVNPPIHRIDRIEFSS